MSQKVIKKFSQRFKVISPERKFKMDMDISPSEFVNELISRTSLVAE